MRCKVAAMSIYLILERPDHGPRLLGIFSTTEDAEFQKAELATEKPSWAQFLSIWEEPDVLGHAARRAESDSND
jgi:hypothetical protein